MADLLRAAPWHETAEPDLTKEWLVTNGLGGYASGTVAGRLTRRYHGLLIAALQKPSGRFMMLNGIDASLRFPEGEVLAVGPPTFPSDTGAVKMIPVAEFRLEE